MALKTAGCIGAHSIFVARIVLTLVNIDITVISSPSFLTRARIAIDLVDTLPVGTRAGRAVINILVAVAPSPPRLTIASVPTGKINAGAILTWIGETFVDWIGRWCDNNNSIAIAVAVVASVDAAVVTGVHVFLAESVARILAELVLRPIISLPVIGIATISELGPSLTGESSSLHPGSDHIRTV